MNIEMHYCLVGQNSQFASYYKNPWEKAKPEKGKKYIQQYSWEDFYVYVIVHMAKHFQMAEVEFAPLLIFGSLRRK